MARIASGLLNEIDGGTCSPPNRIVSPNSFDQLIGGLYNFGLELAIALDNCRN